MHSKVGYHNILSLSNTFACLKLPPMADLRPFECKYALLATTLDRIQCYHSLKSRTFSFNGAKIRTRTVLVRRHYEAVRLTHVAIRNAMQRYKGHFKSSASR